MKKLASIVSRIGMASGGVMGGLALILVGLLLTPILIGIPILLFGIGLLFGGPLIGIVGQFYRCPICESRVVRLPGQRVIKCRACKKRLVFKGGSLTPVV